LAEASVVTGVLVASALVVVLQLPISLPLERDATRRAKRLAKQAGLLAAHEEASFDRLLHAGWRTHVAAEAQRWIVFASIALAAGGYLWYAAYQEDLYAHIVTAQMQPPVVAHDTVLIIPPAAATTTGAVTTAPPVYEPRGWGRLLWLIPLSPFLLVIVFIVMTFLGSTKTAGQRRLTVEEKAVQRTDAANARHAEGDHDAAIAEYTRALALNPRLTSAWNNRGHVHLLLGHLPEAHHDLDTVVRLAPHFLDARAARGHVRLLLDQETLGLADLDAVLALDPANMTALAARADFCTRQADTAGAIAVWTEALAQRPTRGEFYRHRGLLYYEQGDYDHAIGDQTKAIEIEPADAVAWNNRGAAWLKQGSYARADADLREAIRLAPALPNPYRHLAWLQATCPDATYRSGAEAVAHVSRALELAASPPGEWYEVAAAAHAEAGDFAAAVHWQQRGLGETSLAARSEAQIRLTRYQNGRPWRDATRASRRRLPQKYQRANDLELRQPPLGRG
jgi:tetratricopeptide (TPR) repeat protein